MSRAPDAPLAPAASSPTELEHLAGTIERVTFHSPESGFAVLQVQVKGRRDLVAVVGTMPEVRAASGSTPAAGGRSTPQHGQHFKAQVLKTALPDTAEGMQKYLASGLIKGIGPRFAERMVSAFGTAVFDVIEREPQRLAEVPWHRQGASGEDHRGVERPACRAGDHGLPARPRGRHRPGVPDLQGLRRAVDRQGRAGPLPPGEGHPGHRVQDGRRPGGQT